MRAEEIDSQPLVNRAERYPLLCLDIDGVCSPMAQNPRFHCHGPPPGFVDCGLKGPSALVQHALGSMVMDIVRGEHRDAAMAMLGVVPGEERSAEGDGGGDVVEAPREAGVILQGLELRLGAARPRGIRRCPRGWPNWKEPFAGCAGSRRGERTVRSSRKAPI